MIARCCLLAAAALFAACVTSPDPEPALEPAPDSNEYRAQIRRTDGGIPHIRAADAPGIAFGTLYAMAEDNLCTLADQYLTLGAQRAAVHGAGPEDGHLKSDLFYQLFIERGQAEEPLPPDADAVFEAAAAGFNHYLGETGVAALPDPTCRGAAWVRPIDAIDVKRVSRFDWAFAYLLPLISAASPPLSAAAGNTVPSPGLEAEEAATQVAALLEKPKQGGSNAIAVGRDHSAAGGGLLLANPHMPWDEPYQRFYPMHQTIPGKLNVLGANLIGRPRVGFGFTEHVAWTSTVSTAKRVSFYQLELMPGDPTSYRFDGVARAMTPESVRVRVRLPDGTFEERSHTFYSTHFGALLVEGEYFPWTEQRAYAVRMPDAQWRSETSLLDQYAAKTVHELKAVHDRDQFLPVNLIAADHTGEVLYADPGPIPNVTDEQLASCSVMRGAAFDGTMSGCQWRDDADAATPGIIGPSRLPSLVRTDFVTNSNDSYWLANPASPLEGYPKILGTERAERTLRTRSGLAMMASELAGEEPFGLDDLQRVALANENQAGALLRDDLVALCREQPTVELESGRAVVLSTACEILAEWDLHANLNSRGAHLFRQFMSEANGGRFTRRLPSQLIPVVAFDAEQPVATPSGLSPQVGELSLEILGRAVAGLDDAGIALDATLGELQSVTRGDERIPLHGGPEYEGVFNKLEARFQGALGYPEVTRSSSSWILAVEFGEDGPSARGILTYSLSANPESPHYTDQTQMYSRKEWLELPFEEADVAAAALRDYSVVAPRAGSEVR